MEDTVLFEQIRLGNKKAFEAIFRRFYVSMCSVAYRYTRDASAAEDIAQEAFLKLWEKRDSYRDIPDLKTFLYVAYSYLIKFAFFPSSADIILVITIPFSFKFLLACINASSVVS